MRRSGCIWRVVLSLVVALVLLSGCAVGGDGSGPTRIRLSDGTITVPGEAFIDGRNRSQTETQMLVGIVDSPGETTAKCTIQHGAQVHVSQIQRTRGGITRYAHVSNGLCTGWITLSMLSARYQEPVGEKRW